MLWFVSFFFLGGHAKTSDVPSSRNLHQDSDSEEEDCSSYQGCAWSDSSDSLQGPVKRTVPGRGCCSERARGGADL